VPAGSLAGAAVLAAGAAVLAAGAAVLAGSATGVASGEPAGSLSRYPVPHLIECAAVAGGGPGGCAFPRGRAFPRCGRSSPGADGAIGAPPAARTGRRDRAGRPVLAPKLEAFGRIAMSVTMGYMLILML
jgi:hypothetical protein